MGEEYRGGDETGRALVAVERARFMPAMSIESAVERYHAVTEFVSRVLRRDVDYGIIPGTEKRTLLKPGADGVGQLTEPDKREVLLLLQGMLSRREAA
jgi:hypothetical protein